ncbi:MAG: glutamine--fructose-6-phosphate transaminase (isomerizing) [Flavobacteriales bacterium]
MCGIVGYIGEQNGIDVVVKGLQRLEYRGYDSAGVAGISDNKIQIVKKNGRVDILKQTVEDIKFQSKVAIGHTRWATHGEPCDINAHPHISAHGKVAIVHNGIIENYLTLKKELQKKGRVFLSETDSEVIAHLLEEVLENNGGDMVSALQVVQRTLVGAFAVVILTTEQPDHIYAIKKGTPLVLGIGKGENFLASDGTPLVQYTKSVIYIGDGEILKLTAKDFQIYNSDIQEIEHKTSTLELELSMIEKDGFQHFMMKEIFEQPKTIFDSMRGRITADFSEVKLGGINKYAPQLYNANRYMFLACGTSYHAGMVAKYVFEQLCRISSEVDVASEYRYRKPVIHAGDAIFAISQSGETADTIVAIEEAKEHGANIFGICNVVGSTISRVSHEGAYTHAGVEIGVASTKAFTAQLTVLYLFALKIAQSRGTLTPAQIQQYCKDLSAIPDQVAEILKLSDKILEISKTLKDANSMLFLGRGVQFPIALEGALKMKEITYIHAEGYAAGEMKHGPIALIDENVPTVIIAIKDSNYLKVISNIKEIKARKGKVIAIVSKGDKDIPGIADHVIEIPETSELLSPLLTTIPLQLLSYHTANVRGCDIDKPRNLAKSVTVE